MEERAREKGNICLICIYCRQHHTWFFGNIHLFNFQTKILGEVELSLLCVCVLSCFSCVQLFVTPWTVALQAPLSMEFSRREYWSGLPCPLQGDLPDPGIKFMSLELAGGFFTTSAT